MVQHEKWNFNLLPSVLVNIQLCTVNLFAFIMSTWILKYPWLRHLCCYRQDPLCYRIWWLCSLSLVAKYAPGTQLSSCTKAALAKPLWCKEKPENVSRISTDTVMSSSTSQLSETIGHRPQQHNLSQRAANSEPLKVGNDQQKVWKHHKII